MSTVTTYLSKRKGPTSLLVKNLLSYFTYNLDEIENFLSEVVKKNNDCPPMQKYGELSKYLFEHHSVCGIKGKPLKDEVVRNLIYLARKQQGSSLDTDMLLANLTFRLYNPDDMED